MNQSTFGKALVGLCLCFGFTTTTLSAQTESFSSKSSNPFKNPFTVRGEYHTPAFRGWNIGLSLVSTTFRHRYAYREPANSNGVGHLNEMNFLIPEIQVGHRWQKNRGFVGFEFAYGHVNKTRKVAVPDSDHTLHVETQGFNLGYDFYFGWSLQPYREYQKQKNAIMLFLSLRAYGGEDTGYVSRPDGSLVTDVDFGGLYSSMNARLVYEHVIIGSLHARGGLTYSFKEGEFPFSGERTIIGIQLGILNQF